MKPHLRPRFVHSRRLYRSTLDFALFTHLRFHWSPGHSGELPSQWEAIHFRHESHVSVSHQAAEDQPGRGPEPRRVCGYQGHQVRFGDFSKANAPKKKKKIPPKRSESFGLNPPSPNQGFKETLDPVGDAPGRQKTSPPGPDQVAAAPPRHASASFQHQRAHRPGGLKIWGWGWDTGAPADECRFSRKSLCSGCHLAGGTVCPTSSV